MPCPWVLAFRAVEWFKVAGKGKFCFFIVVMEAPEVKEGRRATRAMQAFWSSAGPQ